MNGVQMITVWKMNVPSRAMSLVIQSGARWLLITRVLTQITVEQLPSNRLVAQRLRWSANNARRCECHSEMYSDFPLMLYILFLWVFLKSWIIVNFSRVFSVFWWMVLALKLIKCFFPVDFEKGLMFASLTVPGLLGHLFSNETFRAFRTKSLNTKMFGWAMPQDALRSTDVFGRFFQLKCPLWVWIEIRQC